MVSVVGKESLDGGGSTCIKFLASYLPTLPYAIVSRLYPGWRGQPSHGSTKHRCSPCLTGSLNSNYTLLQNSSESFPLGRESLGHLHVAQPLHPPALQQALYLNWERSLVFFSCRIQIVVLPSQGIQRMSLYTQRHLGHLASSFADSSPWVH